MRDVSDEYGLIAVQGPKAIERLGLEHEPAFTFGMGEIDGIECMIARTGYTGEEGVELLVMAEDAGALWDACWRAAPSRAGSVRATRFASRSATRCTETTSPPRRTPISAGLGWVCALEKDFTGAEELRRVKEEGPTRSSSPS